MKKIILAKAGADCPTDTKMENRLYRWPGSVQGYSNGGKYFTGTSSDAGTTAWPARKNFYANFWKGA